MTEQEFCLRWNNHESNLSTVLESMLKKEALVDVTFACGGQFLKAHRTVLSACSPYFESMFTGITHSHPIVFLCDVKTEEFRLLLDYMYKGEVTVCQNQLPSFLRIAESFQVMGLAEEDKPVTTDIDAVIKTYTAPGHQAPPPDSPYEKDSKHRKKRRKRPEPPFPDDSTSHIFQTPTSQPGPCSSYTTITFPNPSSSPVLPSTSYSLLGSPFLESLLSLQEEKNLASSDCPVDPLSECLQDPGTSNCANVKQISSLLAATPSLVDMASNGNDAFDFGASSSASGLLETAMNMDGSGERVKVSDDTTSTGQERLDHNREPEAPGDVTLEGQACAGPRSGVCAVCGRFRSDLRQHMESHSGSVFQCLICGRSYPRLKTLNQHIKRTHLQENNETSSNPPITPV